MVSNACHLHPPPSPVPKQYSNGDDVVTIWWPLAYHYQNGEQCLPFTPTHLPSPKTLLKCKWWQYSDHMVTICLPFKFTPPPPASTLQKNRLKYKWWRYGDHMVTICFLFWDSLEGGGSTNGEHCSPFLVKLQGWKCLILIKLKEKVQGVQTTA